MFLPFHFLLPSFLWNLSWLPLEAPFIASLCRLLGVGFGPLVVHWFLPPFGPVHSFPMFLVPVVAAIFVWGVLVDICVSFGL